MRTLEHEPWRKIAACRGVDPAVFHPFVGERAMERQAKAICATCSVTAECLSYAMRNFEKVGIWGGLTENERRTLRGQKGATQRAADRRAQRKTG